MQYSTLLGLIERNRNKGPKQDSVTIPKDLFRHLIVTALKAKNVFDESFYLANNPDIRNALQNRQIESAAEHYFQSGYFEGRMPKKFVVDETYYLKQNSDVAEGVAKKEIKSCQSHFDSNGFREGRFPYKGFSLF